MFVLIFSIGTDITSIRILTMQFVQCTYYLASRICIKEIIFKIQKSILVFYKEMHARMQASSFWHVSSEDWHTVIATHVRYVTLIIFSLRLQSIYIYLYLYLYLYAEEKVALSPQKTIILLLTKVDTQMFLF